MAKAAARTKKPARKVESPQDLVPDLLYETSRLLMSMSVRLEKVEKMVAELPGHIASQGEDACSNINRISVGITKAATDSATRAERAIAKLQEATSAAQWNKFWGEQAERITEQFEILKRLEAKYLPAPGEAFPTDQAIEGASSR